MCSANRWYNKKQQRKQNNSVNKQDKAVRGNNGSSTHVQESKFKTCCISSLMEAAKSNRAIKGKVNTERIISLYSYSAHSSERTHAYKTSVIALDFTAILLLDCCLELRPGATGLEFATHDRNT